MTDNNVDAIQRPIADAIRQYLDQEGWKCDVKEREGIVMFGSNVSLPNGEFRVSFDADDERERFGVYVYSSVYIPEAKRLAVAEFITRFNYRIFLGKIEMDLDDGEVRSVVAATLPDSHLSSAMIKAIDDAAHFNLNNAFPGILAVAFGDANPRAEFEKYQQRRVEDAVDEEDVDV